MMDLGRGEAGGGKTGWKWDGFIQEGASVTWSLSEAAGMEEDTPPRSEPENWRRSGATGLMTEQGPVPDPCRTRIVLISFHHSASTVFIPVLWIRRLRVRRGKKSAQGQQLEAARLRVRSEQLESRFSPVTAAGVRGSVDRA